MHLGSGIAVPPLVLKATAAKPAAAAQPTPPPTPVLAEDADDADDGSTPTTATATPCDWELHMQRDARGRLIEFGRGVWSAVYSAVARSRSPAAAPGRIVAVKTPLRRDAHRILLVEAALLSRLSRVAGHERHLVPFDGFVAAEHALVMAAVPLTLAAYITSQATLARDRFSTHTMFDPMLGMERWLAAAGRLVEGLAWLHDTALVVHGDVKPQNILLRVREHDDVFPYDPLYVDFTSADDLSSPSAGRQNHALALSALTPPFAAPELLTIAALTSDTLAPSKAADIFSLAVTLLTAATGDLHLYPGAGSMQCLVMSREGHRVIDFVRSGVNGSRVPRNGAVERILAPAVLKDPGSRVRPGAWLDLIHAEKAALPITPAQL
ncbi:hypothetical protein LOZ66_005784 [Ophidiomyces ophidiicola]|nr:hypothetical protein LOZ66_005784 [Ophidiomyces ophidiicola]